MNYSEISLEILALVECQYIKTTAQFWREFGDKSLIEQAIADKQAVKDKIEFLRNQFDSDDRDSYGIVCAFDDNFPLINIKAKESEKPYLLFYRGDVSLLQELKNNVAVIGVIDPTDEIEQRERVIVKKLIEKGITVVSGLAKGCDEIAHRTCVENDAKTIAILPSTLNKIYPASNRELAESIVEKGGLLITEYYSEPLSKNDAVNRYIERDRLQAMFSKTVIMIASYKSGQGDSGSRHAMGYAENYTVPRYVMYNSETDKLNKQFGLNRDFIEHKKAVALTSGSIEEIVKLEFPQAVKLSNGKPKQMKLF